MRSENLLARIGMEPIVPLKFKTCRAGTSHPQPGCFSFAAASKPNLAVPEARTGPRQSQEASGVPLSPASSRPLGRKLLFGTPASCRRREGAKKFVPRPSPTTVPRSHHLPSPVTLRCRESRPPIRPTLQRDTPIAFWTSAVSQPSSFPPTQWRPCPLLRFTPRATSVSIASRPRLSASSSSVDSSSMSSVSVSSLARDRLLPPSARPQLTCLASDNRPDGAGQVDPDQHHLCLAPH